MHNNLKDQSHSEFSNRLNKLSDIRKMGIDPYPPIYRSIYYTKDLHTLFDSKEVGNSESAVLGHSLEACIAGRLILFRPMGKNAFAHIQDATGRMQIMCNRDHTSLEGYTASSDSKSLLPLKFIEKKLDLGDIIGVEGNLFHTNKGELTLYAKKITLLTKSLLPLPDKHSGLTNKEIRYRKRWLDLIADQEVRDRFQLRSRILCMIRQQFQKDHFIEVETPILQNVYGGAQARPFETSFHALSNQKMYLRIAIEIALKKLIVGGMDRVFEIGKVFRNEGLDRNHNPEFTMLEAYATYWDYHNMMTYVEKLFEKIAVALNEKTDIDYVYQNKTIKIDFKTPWKRISMKESLIEYGKIDSDSMSDEDMRTLLIKEYAFDKKTLEALSRGLLIAKLFEKTVEPHLIQPHHIIDHPIETTPFCKPHRLPHKRKEGLVERFESFIAGQEICNAYTELNDPELQYKLLKQQEQEVSIPIEERTQIDQDFLEAIYQGMPPTAGLGIGIDRLIMLFLHCSSIRDVLYFPFMKTISKNDQEP